MSPFDNSTTGRLQVQLALQGLYRKSATPPAERTGFGSPVRAMAAARG